MRKFSYMALALFCLGLIISGCVTSSQTNKQATNNSDKKNISDKRPTEPNIGLKYHFSQALEFDEDPKLKNDTKIWVWNSLLLIYDDDRYNTQGDMAFKQEARERISFLKDDIDKTPKNNIFDIVPNTIKDSASQLEWYIKPRRAPSMNPLDIGKGDNFIATRVWLELLADESEGWRLPTKKEAEKLCFLISESQRQSSYSNPLSGWWIWTSETKDSIFSWRVEIGNNCSGNWWVYYHSSWSQAAAVRILK